MGATLLSVLGGGFVFFNQALFWMLAVVLERRADPASVIYGGRLAMASLTLGAAVWLSVMFFQWKAGVLRAPDKAVLGLTGVALGWAFSHGMPGAALLGNLVLAAWALRGLARKKVSEKNRPKEATGS